MLAIRPLQRSLPLLFALLKVALGLLLAGYGTYELQRDEYLYLDYGRHLAWGYIEVPPLTALQSWVTLALGGGFFWVKAWPLLWGSLTIYVVVQLARRLDGGPWAQALAGVCYLTTAYGRLNLLFQPNSFEVLTFTLATYLLVRHAQPDGQPRHLYWLGLVLGLGVLNKYTTFFFGAAALGALLLTAPRALGRRPIWRAAGLALLVAAPTLLWQVRHGLPFRHHMALLHDEQLVNVTLGQFWSDQLLLNLPALAIWGPGLWAALRGRPQPAARIVGLVYAGGLLILNLLHGKSYYALGYYPALFAVGAGWWQARLAAWPRLRVVLLLLPLLLLAPILVIIYPILPPAQIARLGQKPIYQKLGINRWEDGQVRALPQDFADMLGWQELADKTYQTYRALPDSTRANTLIKCGAYGHAGAINYYNRNRALPLAQSINGSYLYWFAPRPARPYRNLLLVGQEDSTALAPHFRTFRKIGMITNPYARERGTTIYLGTAPDTAVMHRIYAELHAEQAAWEGGWQP